MRRIIGVVCAVLLHLAFILFGGMFLGTDDEAKPANREVELLSDEPAPPKDADKKKEPEERKEEIETATEEAPDATEILRQLDAPPANDAPALEAASLSAIEAALSGQNGSGDFAEMMSFASGGRIGGTGKVDALDKKDADPFSMAEIDQKPRPVYKASPSYPSELRAKKLEGVVTMLFVVDPAGKVTSPKVEQSTNPAFDKPALDALKQWKFEPAIRAGQRVACKTRVSIRFQPS